MTHLRVAVDIGGTFTDICILDDRDGSLEITKIPSTTDPIDAVLEGLDKAGVKLEHVSLFSHGTTVATNALIERNLPHTALVTTEGFRDIIEIGNATKEDLWDAYKDNPSAYIRRRDRLTISECILADGKLEKPVNESQAQELARVLKKRDYKAIAICFMNSYANPANELWLKEYLQNLLPSVAISTSAEVLPEIFEHERFSTAVVNAVLRPVVGHYAVRLQSNLESRGYQSDVLLLHSGGGVMTPKTIDFQAARLASSGIAAGAIANKYIGEICGYPNVLGVDMGGTSTDVSMTFESTMTTTRDWYIEYGQPISFPSIDIKTIGAGGGSIAWLDEGGALRNGPHSAGSNPGPACYGLGGDEPTNTDANLVLGRLGNDLVGGGLALDVSLAVRAIDSKIAQPLGMDVQTAAEAIINVANANMADAIRLVSISKGYDPRDFALVAFGGAGALHGVALAQELSVPTVIVPPHPGVTSALGCLLVDIRHDLLTTLVVETSQADPKMIEEEFMKLEKEAISRLSTEGVERIDMVLKRSIDMRYAGQWRSLNVSVSQPFTSIDDAVNGFLAQHMREYKYVRDEASVEIFRLNLSAVGITPKAELPQSVPNLITPKPDAFRDVIFAGKTYPTSIFKRQNLSSGAQINGPAVVHQLDSTTVIPPDAVASIDKFENIVINIQRQDRG